MKKKLPTKNLAVGNCGNCPFSNDGDGNPEIGWACEIDYDFETGLALPEYGRKLQPNQAPPDWCRLRHEDVLVQLTVRAREGNLS